MRLAALALLAGCNQLWGFGDPSLAPQDAPPSGIGCATGWAYRRTIAIENDSPSELRDYQIMFPLNTAALLHAHQLQANGGDLRVTTAAGEGPLPQIIDSGFGTGSAIICVAVPSIPAGGSSLVVYYGNPSVPSPPASSPFLQGIIANPSFEEPGGWDIAPVTGRAVATFQFQAPGWATDGAGSLLADLEREDTELSNSRAAISQMITLPEGSDYVIRFDLEIMAASHDGVNGTNDASFIVSGDKWSITGVDNITGIYLGQETTPLDPGMTTLTLELSVPGGTGHGYAKAYVDNLRVRKHASPEPTVQVGPELSCDR